MTARDDVGTRDLPSQLSPDVGLHGAALQAGDGGGGVERVGAVLLAALMRMAGVAAAVGGDGGEPLRDCRRRARR